MFGFFLIYIFDTYEDVQIFVPKKPAAEQKVIKISIMFITCGNMCTEF